MASTHLLCTGTIVRGEIEMDISMPPWVDPHEAIELPPLQDAIDYGAELVELEDGIEDEEWIRRGC
jgi:hypothetical protein